LRPLINHPYLVLVASLAGKYGHVGKLQVDKRYRMLFESGAGRFCSFFCCFFHEHVPRKFIVGFGYHREVETMNQLAMQRKSIVTKL
jgi:hypothetical protein